MSLTEQWKNGKLKEGWYYIECFDEPEHWIDLDFYRTNIYEKGVGYFSHNDWRGIAKVIAPAPSYGHFVELTEKVKENQQLKELLKECKEVIDGYAELHGLYNEAMYILTKIDNAIGEK